MDSDRNKKLAPMTSMSATPATSLSLAQKQKILADAEAQKRMSAQPSPAMMASPMASHSTTSHPASKPGGTTRDLTASLISSNLNQMKQPQQQAPMMKSSQSFSSGWSTAAAAPAFNSGSSMFGQLGGGGGGGPASMGSSFQAGPNVASNNKRPDLSAFDDLLPMKSKSPVSMNAMAGPLQPMQPNAGGQSAAKTPVKSLTTNDINDLLG